MEENLLKLISGLIGLLIILVGYIWVDAKTSQQKRNEKLDTIIEGLKVELDMMKDNVRKLSDSYDLLNVYFIEFLSEVNPRAKTYFDIMMKQKIQDEEKRKRKQR